MWAIVVFPEARTRIAISEKIQLLRCVLWGCGLLSATPEQQSGVDLNISSVSATSDGVEPNSGFYHKQPLLPFPIIHIRID